MIDIKSVLGQDSHFQVNKKVTKLVGIESAYLLSYLIDKDNFYKDNYIERNGDNYFFLQSDKIENDTTLSYKVQKKCIAILEKNDLIKTKLMGIPRKLYFCICKLSIVQKVIYINDETATMQTPESQLSYKETNNKETNNKKLNNNIVKSDFEKTFDDFKDMRKSIRKPMTPRAEQLILKELQNMCSDNEVKKIAILEQSIKNSWQGIFELKTQARTQERVKTSSWL